MAEITITVSKNGDSYKPPYLSDSENHTANTDSGDNNFTTDNLEGGDVVTWKPGNGITSIDEISEKVGGHNNLFEVGTLQQDGNNYKGTIDSGATGTENYNIKYTGDDGNQYTQDPKLSMKPSAGTGS